MKAKPPAWPNFESWFTAQFGKPPKGDYFAALDARRDAAAALARAEQQVARHVRYETDKHAASLGWQAAPHIKTTSRRPR